MNLPKKAKQIIHQTAYSYLWKLGLILDFFFTKWPEHQITTADMKVIRMIPGVTRWDIKRSENLYRQSNMLLIVQVISQNKLQWFGHAIRREEDEMLRVMVKSNMPGKRPNIEEEEPSLRCLDNTDSHLKKSLERNV